MCTRKTLGVLSLLALISIGLYHFRRHLLGRWLHLRVPHYSVVFHRGLLVPTPDGISLATDHYTPKSKGLFPTILIRTPYGRSGSTGGSGVLMTFIAQRFAERGYNVVVQDVRGRFDSSSEFEPFVNEAIDGRATLDWIETQPWFNGLLGMWGPSYLGYVQWAVAPGAPHYLKALMPVISGSQVPLMGIRDGAFGLDTTLRWMVGLDAMHRTRKSLGWSSYYRFIPGVQDRIVARSASHLPLEEADRVAVGKDIPFYRKWLANPSRDDPYWKPLDRSAEFGAITASLHLLGGWYDIFLRDTLSDYASLRAVGRQPYLTIGPWYHLSPSGLLESLRQGMVWFDAQLGGDRRSLRKNPVRIYVMGKNQWQEMEKWPPPTQEKRYFLCSPRALSDQEPPEYDPPDNYTYDPRNPTPSIGGYLMSTHGGACDNRKLEARSDVLVYITLPLETALEFVGAASLDLYAHSSLEHTDFFARICDVLPDGRSLNVCDGFFRVEPGRIPALPDGSLRLRIDLWPAAYCFESGHRIHLLVSSGAHPLWSRNPGSGEPLGTAVSLHPARQTVYHDPAHPSLLVLPIISVD